MKEEKNEFQMKNTNYSYIGISLIILLFGCYIVSYFQKPNLRKLWKVPDFEFINQNGEPITNKSFEGKVYVVDFFFTTCPTICPVMNRKMITIQNEFFGNPDFGIASFSITPGIDTPDILKEYAKRYKVTHKNWHLLTGKPQKEVYDLSYKGFKLHAGNGEEVHGGFEHSGLFALVDKNGFIRSRYDKFGNPIVYYNSLKEGDLSDQIQELKQDIKLLLNE